MKQIIPILAAIAVILSVEGVQAQQPTVVGQWQCEYGTRNIYRTDAHTVYYQALFFIQPNGTFQAQGQDHTSGQFQAQGQWSLQQHNGRWWFSARGQRTMQFMGVVDFAFDSYLTGERNMSLNEQDRPSGIEIASICQRVG